MVVLTENEIDRLIEEDVPYFDLTTHILEIGEKKGEIAYFTRRDTVICGSEECKRVFEKFNIELLKFTPSGTEVPSGEVFLRARGKGADLHRVWKVTQNLLEYASGIATRTRRLVSLAKRVNPEVEIVTTRKSFPLSKKISVKGVLAGGALPHRLGFSETVLIFKQHLNLLGGLERLVEVLPSLKRRVPEKKITVEVESVEEAFAVLKAGADIVQLDKFPVEEVKEVIELRNREAPLSKVAVAGGIREDNVELYASTGAEIIVLSYPYFRKPADIGVKIEPC